jgi:O-acetyl-ADP-ribose deacetylase (regulator of RNase III)
MNFNLTFISLNKLWIEHITRLFKNEIITIVYDDIRSITKEKKIFVSPSNSLGFMDGGLDRILNDDMFPDCRKQYETKIKTLMYRTILGRPYLPVGSAIFVNRELEESGIIFAPTMFKPSDVSKTRNAYHSFLVALYLMKKYNNTLTEPFVSLVVTSHCCGYGMMCEEESAKQMYEAWCDFKNNSSIPDTTNSLDIMLCPLIEDENPNSFDNNIKKIIIV